MRAVVTHVFDSAGTDPLRNQVLPECQISVAESPAAISKAVKIWEPYPSQCDWGGFVGPSWEDGIICPGNMFVITAPVYLHILETRNLYKGVDIYVIP